MRDATSRPADAERGAVLVGVAFAVLGVFALLAAVIEIGSARMAQAELQDAVDVAAREGLRARDLPDADAEALRRAQARDLVQLTFDADLDLATANTDLQLGAGGIVPLDDLAGIGGAGGFDPSTIGRYLPAPELNRGNAVHGDLVAGTFDGDAPAFETATYARLDFAPAAQADSASSDAFLVRTRRTTDALGLDAIDGVSSSGPPLPYLFGLGTTAQPVDASGAVYDPRRDGITVRATAIADARPALAVALGPDGEGLVEFGESAADGSVLAWALDAAYWSALTEGDVVALVSDAGQVLDQLSGALAGAIVAVDTLTEVGDVLPAVTTDLVPSIADLAATDGARPILLVQAEAAGLVRVVALGALDVVTTATDPISGELRFQSIRPGAIIAHQRASLRAPGAWLALETGGPAEVPGLRAAFDAVPDKLQAPALVR